MADLRPLMEDICVLASLYADRSDWTEFALLANPLGYYHAGRSHLCVLAAWDLAGDLHQWTFEVPPQWYFETRYFEGRVLAHAIAAWIVERIDKLPRNLHPTA